MKYRAIVKSPMEIIGKDVKEFELEIKEVRYCYILEMYDMRGKEIIVTDNGVKYDYYSENQGCGWLKNWLKNIRPIEEKWRAFKGGEMPIECVNYIYRKKYLVSQQFRVVGYNRDSTSQLRFYDGWLSNIEVFSEREVSKDGGKTWEPVGVKE